MRRLILLRSVIEPLILIATEHRETGNRVGRGDTAGPLVSTEQCPSSVVQLARGAAPTQPNPTQPYPTLGLFSLAGLRKRNRAN